MKRTVLAGFLLVFLASCSSNQEISKKEVKKVVNEMYAEEPICLQIRIELEDNHLTPYYQFGDHEIKIKYKDIDGKKVNKLAIEQMHILQKQGFYKEVRTETVKLQDNIKTQYKVWNLTHKGQNYFNGGNTICLGQFEFSDLEYYSLPVANRGLLVSYVTYTIEPKIEKWAKPFLKVSDKSYEQYIDSKQEKVSTFYLTNQGWKILRRHR